MGFPRRKFLRRAAAVALLALVSPAAWAQVQDFPSRPVRIITHPAAGGSPDALLRIVADRLSQMWGRPVLTLNHPGAVARRSSGGAGRPTVVLRFRFGNLRPIEIEHE